MMIAGAMPPPAHIVIRGELAVGALDGLLPPFAHDHDQQRRSLDRLRRERDTGTRIIPGRTARVVAPIDAS